MGLKLDPVKDRDFLMKMKDKTTGKSLMELVLQNNIKAVPLGEELLKHTSSDDPEITSKCGNRRKIVGGVVYDSEWEYQCWMMLKDLEREGTIRKAQLKTTYKFIHNEVYITKFVADFSFEVDIGEDYSHWVEVAADAKSEYTKGFARVGVTKRMMQAFYGMEVLLFIKGQTNVSKLIKDHIVKLSYELSPEEKEALAYQAELEGKKKRELRNRKALAKGIAELAKHNKNRKK